ncbi:suppressor protein DnaK [Knoellia flava TL1]|uniref:DnaK suppressor protein n=2 Tax=Knoellia flava TaxID=913969 RepID=A0A8H9FT79_9MICO|nr:TraR/DksA C4-type zinc finger protein [Knoellia flava]KGN30023.1 suppressor protein DnaK [Knoellia flava TL1]GGB82211.1 DnaK suppressor protein [Knoellia flava]
MIGFRDALEDDRRVTLDRLAALTGDFDRIVEASRDSNADDEHDPEGATIAFERSQVDALAQQARSHLDEVDAALSRLGDGSYGTCERCGNEIAAARLEARPTARTCVTCPRP